MTVPEGTLTSRIKARLLQPTAREAELTVGVGSVPVGVMVPGVAEKKIYVGVRVGPNVGVGYMTVGLGSGVNVAVGVGAGGVYMAVCVPKKDATIEPTAEVIKASGLSVGASSPVQAVNMDTIKITMSMLVMYLFIRVSGMSKPFQIQRHFWEYINLTQNYKNQMGEIPTFAIRVPYF